jgi:hypothetical protein
MTAGTPLILIAAGVTVPAALSAAMELPSALWAATSLPCGAAQRCARPGSALPASTGRLLELARGPQTG